MKIAVSSNLELSSFLEGGQRSPAADTAGNAPLEAAAEGGFPAGADDDELPPHLQFLSPKIQ